MKPLVLWLCGFTASVVLGVMLSFSLSAFIYGAGYFDGVDGCSTAALEQ
jgi:hypothetical protein